MKTSKINGLVDFSSHVTCRVVEQGCLEGDNHWRWHNISSPFHRLYYIQEGRAYVGDDHRTYSLLAGNVYLLRRNTWMDYYAESPFKKLYFHLNYYSDMGYDLLDGLENVTRLEVSERSLERLEASFEGDGPSHQAKLMSELYGILSQALEMGPAIYEGYSRSRYRDLIKRIVEKGDVRFSVETMAKMAGQSKSDFSRKFKSEIGVPPKHFLHEQISEKATMLLLTTDMTIKAIALTLGFDDSLYFSRFFKKRVGMSPLVYRQSQMKAT